MFKKISVYCLIVSVLLIGNNLGAEVIINHMMAKDSNSGTDCQPPTPNYTFGTRDERAYCWVDVDDVIEGDIVKYEWYDPNSELVCRLYTYNEFYR